MDLGFERGMLTKVVVAILRSISAVVVTRIVKTGFSKRMLDCFKLIEKQSLLRRGSL